VIRVAVVGKGGAGKSVLAGTLARILARRGEKVLALDSDTMPGLAYTLGTRTPRDPPLLAAAERGEDKRWRFVEGVGPVRAVQRYAHTAPEGVRLLEFGKMDVEGQPRLMPAIQAFYKVVHGIGQARALREWSFVGDLPAGPRQVGYDWAPYAETFILVVEPTIQSLLAGARIGIVASEREGPTVTLVASKVGSDRDVRRIEEFLGARAMAVIPRDPAVSEAERLGIALIDHAPDSPTVRAVADLASKLTRQRSTQPTR
jgi:CO dehydrogenase maturation factor